MHAMKSVLARVKNSRFLPAVKVALIYAVFAAVWIIFSDKALDLLTISKITASLLQTWKGLLFVAITTVLIFVLIQLHLDQQTQLFIKLEQNQQRLKLILDTVPNGIQENDLQGRITYSNSAHHKILRYPQWTLIGHYIWDFQTTDEEKHRLQSYFNYLIEHQTPAEPYVTRNLTSDGQERTLEISWDYQRDSNGKLTGFISVISDITHVQQQEKEIQQLVYFDTLTDLPNRFRSLQQLSSLIKSVGEKNQQLAVLLLDLDNFKKINDSLGHDVGDRLLNSVAIRLRSQLDEQQVLGRLGGDEFIIIQPLRDENSQLTRLMESLLQLFETPFTDDFHEMTLTASMGIAIYPKDGSTDSELLRNAESAMFYAKDTGRHNYAYFTDAMNLDVKRRFAVEQQLHSALENNEFKLLYQPKVDLRTGLIVGAEALLRWDSAALGQVSPCEFIPIAEQSNFIVPLGRWVLEHAIGLTGQIQQQLNSHFQMAINLSPSQFRDYGLIETLRQLANACEVNLHCIELEITEGVLLSGSTLVDETLSEINQMGISLAIDDFGTGYSSLNYLRHYPFNVLKIDRSFIHDLSFNASDREMVSAIIGMAKGLGLRVVAEGVETKEQAILLNSLGCEYGQGFYYSKPITAVELQNLVEKQKNIHLFRH